jgi:hypothetical protein
VVEKDASQRFGAAETRNLRGISDGAAGVKCRARHIDSNLFDIARRSCPQFGLKHPGQLLRDARAASFFTLWSVPGLAVTASVITRSGDSGGGSVSTSAENCDCPPARLRYTTSDRATSRTNSGP